MMGDKADPPSAVGGLEGIDKRVGSRGKKKKAKEKVYKRRQTHLAQWVGLKLAIPVSRHKPPRYW